MSLIVHVACRAGAKRHSCGLPQPQSGANCAGGESEGYFEEGSDIICTGDGIPMADGEAATNRVGSWPLPDKWFAFFTPEERDYFFDARRDVVQWERPAR